MKKLLQIFLLVLFVLISCSKKSEKKIKNKNVVTEKKSVREETTSVKNKFKIDTTKVRKHAELILKDKIYPSDDKETLKCIKQIFTQNKNDLEFYFKVFRVIVKKSDGALSEAIGLEIMNFIKYNPDFFIEQYSEFKRVEREKFIGFIAYEFYFTEPKHKSEIDKYFLEVNSRLKQNTEYKRKYLNAIKELTKVTTERMIKE